jgi:hypothetical protein
MAPIPAAITQKLRVVFLITSSLIEEPDLQRQAGAVSGSREPAEMSFGYHRDVSIASLMAA